MGGAGSSADSLALSVHGPAGVLDLVVPPDASIGDLAAEYAARCGSPRVPVLHRGSGEPLDPRCALAEAGVGPGTLLVAAGPLDAVRRSARRARDDAPRVPAMAAAVPVGWGVLAATLALLGGWSASRVSGTGQDVAIALLAGAAVLGVAPGGPWATPRILAAPAFAGAAAYAVVWSPVPERLPTVVGAAALVAGLTAAVARALDDRSEEALRVWIATGVAVFVVGALAAGIGWPPQVVWSVLLAAASLAARWVPAVSVAVPDHHLLDLDRLAVTAWSAREGPPGRGGCGVVPLEVVSSAAARGTRLLTASSAAVWVVAALAAPLLLGSATLPVDRVGARVQVLLAGVVLLLGARSYRHRSARVLLRLAGLSCWAALLTVVLQPAGTWRTAIPTAVVIVLGVTVLVAAVATGRGWRSAWWSRRAEVAEGLVGAGALAAVVVATGLVRTLWELRSMV